MENKKEFTLNGDEYTLDDKSKAMFWNKMNNIVKTATREAGLDPTDLLKWKNGEYYLKADDLITWLNIVYPNSTVQTEKVVFSNEICQYKCIIYKDENSSHPTIAEGSLIIKNDNGEYYQRSENYVSSAQTTAIVKAIRLLGIGTQCKDEYYVQKVENDNSAPTSDPKPNPNFNVGNFSEKNQSANKQTQQCTMTLDSALSHPVTYMDWFKGPRQWEGVALGDVSSSDKIFFRQIPMKNYFDNRTRECANFILRNE